MLVPTEYVEKLEKNIEISALLLCKIDHLISQLYYLYSTNQFWCILKYTVYCGDLLCTVSAYDLQCCVMCTGLVLSIARPILCMKYLWLLEASTWHLWAEVVSTHALKYVQIYGFSCYQSCILCMQCYYLLVNEYWHIAHKFFAYNNHRHNYVNNL